MHTRIAPIALWRPLHRRPLPRDPSGSLPAASPLVISEATLALAGADAADVQDTSAPHPVAMEYSDGYMLRRKIHKVASLATIPLFVSDLAIGQSLYDGTSRSDSKRNAHAVLGGGLRSRAVRREHGHGRLEHVGSPPRLERPHATTRARSAQCSAQMPASWPHP